MLRVLLVTGSYPPDRCGVGDYTSMLASALSATGEIEVGILTSLASTAPTGHEHAVPRPLKSIRHWRLRDLRQFRSVIKSWRPDIVHLQYPTQGYASGWLPALIPLLGRWMGSPSVQTWHEAFGGSQGIRLALMLASNPVSIVVRSNFMQLVHPILRPMLVRRELNLIPNASAIPRTTRTASEIAEVRDRLLGSQRRLIVFFGFLLAKKGAELLYEIADPATDKLVFVGPSDKEDTYLGELQRLADQPRWSGKVLFTGFVESAEAAVILAASDAVVLPFRDGGGDWNTSIHGAVVNGAFVVTTSAEKSGYDSRTNVYHAPIDDVVVMKKALREGGSHGRERDSNTDAEDDWHRIARAHIAVYTKALADASGLRHRRLA